MQSLSLCFMAVAGCWHKRVVDLDTVAKEWDAANLKLIDFVATNHEALREHITKEETK